ncbi:hypothetical protein ACPRNU_09290 [Chromobacterium vaccinii]|uniref:hypothetical protein n=1 Tax=Chromobacterium vaccinii TaxID=1108595 RepID=UPI003C774030
MPRDIPTPRPPAACEGVLIRRASLQPARRADELERAARRRARRITDEADAQADAVRGQAWRDGYQDGMLAALDQVAAHLADNQALARRWRERLADEARAMLRAATDHPDALLLALDEWLREQSPADDAPTLKLLLPESARPQQPRLMALLADAWNGRLQLDYHADDRLLIRYADQAAEFAPELYVEPASRQALQCLDSLPRQCRALSATALETLLQTLRRRLDPAEDATMEEQT